MIIFCILFLSLINIFIWLHYAKHAIAMFEGLVHVLLLAQAGDPSIMKPSYLTYNHAKYGCCATKCRIITNICLVIMIAQIYKTVMPHMGPLNTRSRGLLSHERLPVKWKYDLIRYYRCLDAIFIFDQHFHMTPLCKTCHRHVWRSCTCTFISTGWGPFDHET